MLDKGWDGPDSPLADSAACREFVLPCSHHGRLVVVVDVVVVFCFCF